MPRMGGDLDDELIFKSGHKINCPGGIVGLPLEGQGMPFPSSGASDLITSLTPEERHELADAMIEAWKRFKLSTPA